MTSFAGTGLSGFAATGLHGGYGTASDIVRGVDLQAPFGTLTCVIGPNGAGKSTALKLAAGLLRPRAGRVVLGADELTGLTPQGALAVGLVFVPQERNVFASLSVAENLRMGAFTARDAAPRLADAYARFPELYACRRSPAAALSGGQRQVLAVAAALMARPRALLLDEPTAGLSPQAAARLLDVVVGLARSGLAVLMVEQNALDALAVSDRAVVMVDGRAVRDGAAHAVANDPDIRRLFLGGRTMAATEGLQP